MGARFNYGQREEMGYNPYGTVFTPRQERIILGLPVNGLRTQEITTVIRKAEKLELLELSETVFDMYEEILTDRVPPKHTIEEAKSILQNLTPWER